MSAPVDRREWLINKGLAKPGRGKFSNAAKEAMTAAEAEGVVFLEKGQAMAVVSVVSEDGTVSQETRNVDIYAPHPDPIREGYLTFGNGKGFTLTVHSNEACSECRYSFGWCYCTIPSFRYWKTGEILTLNG